MKTKMFFFLCLWYAAAPFCWAQLTIDECYRKAKDNYPLIRQYALIERTQEYNLENAARGYLPQLTFSAQATYQSDVTKIPIDLDEIGLTGINIPTVSRAQYKAEIGLNQTLWDGGAIRAQRKTLRSQAEVEQKNLDVSLYALNERINQLYFGILLTDAQLEQNRILQRELERHCKEVSSYITNGVANQADLDALRVDWLKSRQDEVQISHTRRAYVEMLSQFIGEQIDEHVTLVRPADVRLLAAENNRPELALFDAQIRNLQAQDARVTAGLMPRLGLFVTGGYGKPGLDMLENEFKAYYLAGVRLSWNIGNFWTQKNDRRKIQTDIRSMEAQRETFLFNTALDVTRHDAAIDRYVEQLKYDDEIIALRKSVRLSSEAKMAGGTLSGTDLTRDIHAEQAAIQDKLVHEINLLMAIYNRKYAMND